MFIDGEMKQKCRPQEQHLEEAESVRTLVRSEVPLLRNFLLGRKDILSISYGIAWNKHQWRRAYPVVAHW